MNEPWRCMVKGESTRLRAAPPPLLKPNPQLPSHQNISPSKVVRVGFIFSLRVVGYSNGHVSLSPYGCDKFRLLPYPFSQIRVGRER